MFSYNTECPPLIGVSSSKRNSKAYKKAVLDFMEREGYQQTLENLEKFQDYYDMFDGTLSRGELRDMFQVTDEMLSKADYIPTWIRHYDIIGAILKGIVGKLIDMKQKFNVIEDGKEVENEFLEFKSGEIEKMAGDIIDNAIKLGLARKGISTENKQFNSIEEQQQYLQQVENLKSTFVPKIAESVKKFPSFKSIGVKWGENILDRDREMLENQYIKMFKHWLLTGICAKITKVNYDTVRSYVWDSREVFHSRDIGEEFLNRFQYVGRYHYKTPSQVVEEYGQKMTENQKIRLLSAGDRWSELFDNFANLKGSPTEAMGKFFHEKTWVGVPDYYERKRMGALEKYTGIPMGTLYSAEDDGWKSTPTFINRGYSSLGVDLLSAASMESRFKINPNVCAVTEVYVRVYEKMGWLKYEDDLGNPVTEFVTEDIYKDFLKENNIKQVREFTFEDILKDDQEINTIVWNSMPIYYEGIKIQGGYLEEPIYLCFEKMDYQITDISTFDVKNPVSGIITSAIAPRMAPYQQQFNVMMNQIRQISETEVGTFFVMDVMNVASEYASNGEGFEDSIINMRNMAKKTKMLTVATNPNNVAGGNVPFNQFQAYNLSDIQGVQWRLQVADRLKMECYSQIGLNPQQSLAPTQYANEEGIKLSNESMNDQLADIFYTFNNFIKEDQIQHLNVNHWMQSFDLDKTMFYVNGYGDKIFLDVSKDFRFSFRRIGLNISDDSRKKKDFENLKSYLLSQNTMGGDALSFGKLVFSDTATELIQIAQEERQIANQRAELEHNRLMEQISAENEAKERLEQAKWERSEITNTLDRENKIEVKRVDALGRAADNNADDQQLKMIQTAADIAVSKTKETNRQKLEEAKLDQKQQAINLRKKELSDKHLLDIQKEANKMAIQESKERIAIINPS